MMNRDKDLTEDQAILDFEKNKKFNKQYSRADAFAAAVLDTENIPNPDEEVIPDEQT